MTFRWSGFLLSITVLLSPVTCLAAAPATAASGLNSQTCDQVFGLSQNTVAGTANNVMTPEVCAAYKDLLTRYVPGKDSLKCGPDIKTKGITSLNPDFAVRLDKLLLAGDAAVGRYTINSAYRCPAAQASANPKATAGGFVSMHLKGLAVDLTYPGGGTKDDCSSAGYNWIIANGKSQGIAQYDQVHSPVSGECNHIEDAKGVSGLGIGGGIQNQPPAATNPFQGAMQAAQNFFTPSAPTAPAPSPVQQPMSAAQNPLSYSQPSPTPITTNTSPTASGLIQANTNTNSNTNTGASSLINALANPIATPTPSVPSGSAIALNTALNNSNSLQATPPQILNGNLAAQTPIIPVNPQTFTSQDLSQTPATAPLNSALPSPTFTILENLKQTLLQILHWLVPSNAAPTLDASTPLE